MSKDTPKAIEFGLTPNSDLTKPINQLALHKYWTALRNDNIRHLINTGDRIPSSVTMRRLCREFPKYTADELSAFYDNIDMHDDIDDICSVDEHLSEEDEQDLLDFIADRIAQREAEDEMFRGMIGKEWAGWTM